MEKETTKYQQSIIDFMKMHPQSTFYADEENFKCWFTTNSKVKTMCRYSAYLGLLRAGKLILKKHFKDIPLDCMVFEYAAI